MFVKILFLCLVCYVCGGSAASVPFITKCKAADSKCLKSSANAVVPIFVRGIEEYGVETLEPMPLKKTIDASVPGLKLMYKNMTVTGLKDCTIESIYRDKAKSKLGGKILCTAGVVGQYDMAGRLLILNVKGKGDFRSLLHQILITIDVDVGEKVGKDGIKYWDLKRFTHSFDLLQKSEVEFKNLVTGSAVLDRAANDVITTNSNDVVKEIGHPIIRAIVTKIVENVRRFFHRIPPADLALD